MFWSTANSSEISSIRWAAYIVYQHHRSDGGRYHFGTKKTYSRAIDVYPRFNKDVAVEIKVAPGKLDLTPRGDTRRKRCTNKAYTVSDVRQYRTEDALP